MNLLEKNKEAFLANTGNWYGVFDNPKIKEPQAKKLILDAYTQECAFCHNQVQELSVFFKTHHPKIEVPTLHDSILSLYFLDNSIKLSPTVQCYNFHILEPSSCGTCESLSSKIMRPYLNNSEPFTSKFLYSFDYFECIKTTKSPIVIIDKLWYKYKHSFKFEQEVNVNDLISIIKLTMYRWRPFNVKLAITQKVKEVPEIKTDIFTTAPSSLKEQPFLLLEHKPLSVIPWQLISKDRVAVDSHIRYNFTSQITEMDKPQLQQQPILLLEHKPATTPHWYGLNSYFDFMQAQYKTKSCLVDNLPSLNSRFSSCNLQEKRLKQKDIKDDLIYKTFLKTHENTGNNLNKSMLSTDNKHTLQKHMMPHRSTQFNDIIPCPKEDFNHIVLQSIVDKNYYAFVKEIGFNVPYSYNGKFNFDLFLTALGKGSIILEVANIFYYVLKIVINIPVNFKEQFF